MTNYSKEPSSEDNKSFPQGTPIPEENAIPPVAEAATTPPPQEVFTVKYLWLFGYNQGLHDFFIEKFYAADEAEARARIEGFRRAGHKSIREEWLHCLGKYTSGDFVLGPYRFPSLVHVRDDGSLLEDVDLAENLPQALPKDVASLCRKLAAEDNRLISLYVSHLDSEEYFEQRKKEVVGKDLMAGPPELFPGGRRGKRIRDIRAALASEGTDVPSSLMIQLLAGEIQDQQEEEEAIARGEAPDNSKYWMPSDELEASLDDDEDLDIENMTPDEIDAREELDVRRDYKRVTKVVQAEWRDEREKSARLFSFGPLVPEPPMPYIPPANPQSSDPQLEEDE